MRISADNWFKSTIFGNYRLRCARIKTQVSTLIPNNMEMLRYLAISVAVGKTNTVLWKFSVDILTC